MLSPHVMYSLGARHVLAGLRPAEGRVPRPLLELSVRRLVVDLADLTDPERGRGIEKCQVDALLGHVGHHLVRRVGVSPQVAVGRLAAVPLGAGEEGNPATVLFRKVFPSPATM